MVRLIYFPDVAVSWNLGSNGEAVFLMFLMESRRSTIGGGRDIMKLIIRMIREGLINRGLF